MGYSRLISIRAARCINASEVPNFDPKGMIFIPIGPVVKGKASGQFYDFYAKNLSRTPSNSLQNSEFGVRYSSLLPIGNGLQTSFIYLYEFRSALGATCATCTGCVDRTAGRDRDCTGHVPCPRALPQPSSPGCAGGRKR